MARKKPPAVIPQVMDVQTAVAVVNQAVQNGLESAILGSGVGGGNALGFGFPGNQGVPGFSEQVSQATTIFKNLRYYFVSNFRQILSEAYVEISLVANIVDIPVDDALRGGVEIKSNQLNEEEIEELRVSLDRDDDMGVVGQAAKWNRLFGGAGILILTDQDPEEELVLEDIDEDTPLEFRAVDMWELFWDKQNTEGYDPAIQQEDFEFYNYYGERVHKSRVMRLKGITAPSFNRPRLRGWGFSVVERLVRSINQYLKDADLTFEVLDEFKLDVYKIKNLVNTLMSPQGEEKVTRRIRLANYQKNYQNAIIMDSEDDYDHKQLSFAGLAEIKQESRMQVSADMRIPAIKLFGTPASGLNGSDEESLEVYNCMVESEVRDKIKYDILRVLEIKCQKLFGFVPDDLSITFKPLRMLSSEQEQTVKSSKHERLMAAKEKGLITDLEYRDACNKGQLFDITLDTSEAAIAEADTEASDDMAAEGENNPAKPKSGGNDDPGANRIDTKKPRVGDKGGAPKGGKKKPTSNVHFMPTPWTRIERAKRAVSNSAEFDKASYEADGGDEWIDSRRKELFMNPGNVDEGLWTKARERAKAAGGSWKMVTWLYKKMGGKFK